LINPPPAVHPPLAVQLVGARPGYVAAVAGRRDGVLVHEAKRPELLAIRDDITRSAPDSGPAERRDLLRRSLPIYMMPAAVVVVDDFKLTPSGKLDR
jgi:acyl-CoA synthetase (AMP-forming)/AMP-acid ligase II